MTRSEVSHNVLGCCVAAATLVRIAAKSAFSLKQRGMLTGDIVDFLPNALDRLTAGYVPK